MIDKKKSLVTVLPCVDSPAQTLLTHKVRIVWKTIVNISWMKSFSMINDKPFGFASSWRKRKPYLLTMAERLWPVYLLISTLPAAHLSDFQCEGL